MQVPLKHYNIAVYFGSICCGPASPDFLKVFITNFNKKYKVSIMADIASGCGREGEFIVLLDLSNLAKNKKKAGIDFYDKLNKLVARETEKNRKASNSSGTLEIMKNISESQFKNCRTAVRKWI
jgi:hypothetical protein